MQMVRRIALLLSIVAFVLVLACGSENGPEDSIDSTSTPTPQRPTSTPQLSTTPPSVDEPTPNIGGSGTSSSDDSTPNSQEGISNAIVVLLDNFEPQPLRGDDIWFFNRLDSDRGQIGDSESGILHWGEGRVTAEVTSKSTSRIGSWNALNHIIREELSLNFSAIFDEAILPMYQGKVIGVRFQVQDGRGLFHAELEAPDRSLPWREQVMLLGGSKTLTFDLPDLAEIKSLNWLLEGESGDFVVLDRIELLVELPNMTAPERAFLYNYAMLLSNFDWETGLTRDRHRWPSGDFDNVSASGLQAAAAVVAENLNFISRQSATEIVNRTTSALLELPRCNGLWPHFVRNGDIVPGTEFSSIDSLISMYSVIQSMQALNLDPTTVERVLTEVNWEALILSNGSVSHGLDAECDQRLGSGWDGFGSESWFVNLGYATATGDVAKFDTTSYRTFNGAGFITEIAWLFVPSPDRDRFGVNWTAFRRQVLEQQLTYYSGNECYSRNGFFGLSAAEVPIPYKVAPSDIYAAFGTGGDVGPNDGTQILGSAVVTPHYAALIASLDADVAIAMWEELIQKGLFTPLNNVESLMFVDEPTCQRIAWNSLKGSLNLGFSALGWGRFLSGDAYPLYKSLWDNDVLRSGYDVLCIGCSGTSLVSTGNDATGEPVSLTPLALLILEGEQGSGTGSTMPRSQASAKRTELLHVNEFTEMTFSLPAGARYEVSSRYSNDGGADVVEVLVDGVVVGQFTSVDTRPVGGTPGGGWDSFADSGVVGIVELGPGTHKVKVVMKSGDSFGVEIDKVTLTKTD